MPSLEAAAAGPHALVGVATAPPRRAGRGRREAPNAVAEFARVRDLPLARPERARDPGFLAWLRDLAPDLAVVVSYGHLLPKEVLEAPRFGCVNVHASLLPRWRGASPIQAALLAGDAETGVTIQRMVEELDAGPVLAAAATPIGRDEDAAELAPRLARLGGELLGGFLAGLDESGPPPGEPQDESRVTTCRKVKPADAVLDWARPAAEVARHVRAYAGWPVARTTLPGGEPLLVHRGEVAEGASAAAEPGAVLAAAADFVVACGEGAYRIQVAQRPGRAVLPADAFLRGARLAAGEVLGR